MVNFQLNGDQIRRSSTNIIVSPFGFPTSQPMAFHFFQRSRNEKITEIKVRLISLARFHHTSSCRIAFLFGARTKFKGEKEGLINYSTVHTVSDKTNS